MKKASALIEFTLTTTMLGIWAIACAAAFQSTSNPPATNGSAGHAEQVSVAASHQPADPVGVTLEAALAPTPREPVPADRI